MALTARKPSADGKRSAALARASLRIKEEAERYRQLVELQSDYLSLATQEGELIYVNAAYANLHASRPDDLIGRSLFEFVPNDQRASLKARIGEVLRDRRMVQSKNQVVTPGGESRWVQWTNMGFCGADGVVLLHSVGRDIQAQIETETRLRESEARFRLLAEASLDVVIALDRNLRRTYVSPSSREVFGLKPEELIGGEIGLSAHPDDAGRLRSDLLALLEGRLERHVNVVRRRHRDGRWIWLEACYRAVRDPATVRFPASSLRCATFRRARRRKKNSQKTIIGWRRSPGRTG